MLCSLKEIYRNPASAQSRGHVPAPVMGVKSKRTKHNLLLLYLGSRTPVLMRIPFSFVVDEDSGLIVVCVV